MRIVNWGLIIFIIAMIMDNSAENVSVYGKIVSIASLALSFGCIGYLLGTIKKGDLKSARGTTIEKWVRIIVLCMAAAGACAETFNKLSL